MAEFKTHVGLTLRWKLDEEHRHLITIEGDRVKELYRGTNMGAAAKVFKDAREHYQKREREET